MATCDHKTVLVFHRDSSVRHVDDVCCPCRPDCRCQSCRTPVPKDVAAATTQEHGVPTFEWRRVAA